MAQTSVATEVTADPVAAAVASILRTPQELEADRARAIQRIQEQKRKRLLEEQAQQQAQEQQLKVGQSRQALR